MANSIAPLHGKIVHHHKPTYAPTKVLHNTCNTLGTAYELPDCTDRDEVDVFDSVTDELELEEPRSTKLELEYRKDSSWMLLTALRMSSSFMYQKALS